MKPVPLAVCAALLWVPWVLGRVGAARLQRHASLVMLVMVGVMLGYVAGFMVAITLFPNRSGEHVVMPIGQALFGGPLGSVVTCGVGFRFMRARGRNVTWETRALAALGTVAALELLGHHVLEWW